MATILSKIDGMYLQDVSAITGLVPNTSNYTVQIAHPGSAYATTVRLDLPSDVMLKATADALVYKGTVNGATSSPGTNAPFTTGGDKKGYTYKVKTAGYITGVKVEIGDMVICNTDTTTSTSSSTNYDFIQSNLDPTKTHAHSVTISNNTGNAGGFTPKGTISTDVIAGVTTFTGANKPAGTISGTYSTTSTQHSHSFTGSIATLSTTYDKSANKTEAASVTKITIPKHEYTPQGSVTNSYTATDVAISGSITQAAHSHSFNGTAATITMSYKKSATNTGNSTTSLNGSIADHTYKPTGTLSNSISYTTTAVTDTTHSLKAASHSHSFNGSNTVFSTTYTPAGTISAPVITTTLSSKSITYATGAVTWSFTTESKTTSDTWIKSYTYTTASEELTFNGAKVPYIDKYISSITLTTASSGNLLTNVTAGSAVPTFYGTQVTLKPSGTPLGTIGTSGDLTVTGTIGAKYQKTTGVTGTFYGDSSTITHSHTLSVANHNHSITLTDTTISATYTPAGTLSTSTPAITDSRSFKYDKANASASFSGTLATLSHTETSIAHTHNITLTTTALDIEYTPAGTIDKKTVSVSGAITGTFYGTTADYSVSGTPVITSATSTFYGTAVANHSHSFSSSTTSGANTPF